MHNKTIINDALDYTRLAVGKKIAELIDQKKNVEGAYEPLYTMLSDYPFRKGKGLRPTLCISVARGVHGMGHAALVSSTALELYHNAFLIHDDVEDGSENRRGKETLHQLVGIPRAVNIGDATNVLAVSLLLENLNEIGVAKALHIIHEIEQMARQSVEGQSMELDWVANHQFDLNDEDYFVMCTKKTCWYTFISPCRIGYIVGAEFWKDMNMPQHLEQLTRFGMYLGIAFQIQDDLLNLIGSEQKYGKEIAGDIYEGKRTIMLNHLIRNAGKNEAKIKNIIKLARTDKKQEDVDFVLSEMHRCGSIVYGQELALKMAKKASKLLEEMSFFMKKSPVQIDENWESDVVDYRFIREIVNYVIERDL
ncbi:polyprenyl synthetase family protein [Flavobacteriaceae bacterium 3-367]